MADANQLADFLGVIPLYKHKECARWSSAVHLYQEMLSNANSENPSPEEPRTPDGTPEKDGLLSPPTRENTLSHPMQIGNSRSLTNLMIGHTNASCPSFPVSKSGHFLLGCLTPGGSGWGSGIAHRAGSQSRLSPEDANPNSLELEAVAAVHELSFAVDATWVSEMLPRTPELLFVNVTTVEGQPLCLELTKKGWRVTSLRHDCMTADINHLDLHIRYFDSVYALMEEVSEGYKNRFGEALAARLQQLEMQQTEQQTLTRHRSDLRNNWSDGGLQNRILVEEQETEIGLEAAEDSPMEPEARKSTSEPIEIPLRKNGEKSPDGAPSLAVNIRVTVRRPSGDGKKQPLPMGSPNGSRPLFEF